MLRGCQKRVIFLKNTGSKIFDGAYFLISDNDKTSRMDSEDMIAEAGKIIEENIIGKKRESTQSKIKRMRGLLLSFILGGIVCSLVTVLLIGF